MKLPPRGAAVAGAARPRPVRKRPRDAPLPPLADRLRAFLAASRLAACPAGTPTVSQGLARVHASDPRRLVAWPPAAPVEHEGTVLAGSYWVPEAALRAADGDYEARAWFTQLTLRPRAGTAAARAMAARGRGPKWHLWYRRDGLVGFPRALGLSLFGPPARDARADGGALRPEAVVDLAAAGIALRPEQDLALAWTRAALDHWGMAMLEAACGVGKTLLATVLALERGRRVLVVAPNVDLVEQWMLEMGRYAPAARVAVLRGSWPADPAARVPPRVRRAQDAVRAADVVVTTDESAARAVWPVDLLRSFGTLVLDEAHLMAARSLSVIVPRVPARFVLGVTATPDRADELGHALPWLMGPCAFRYQRVPELTGVRDTARVERLRVPVPPAWPIVLRGGELAWTPSLVMLSAYDARNDRLVGLLRELLEDRAPARRKILVLCAYRDHVAQLRARCLAEIPSIAGAADPAAAVAVLQSGEPPRERARARVSPAVRVVIATLSFVKIGYNDPTLDTIVLASPLGTRGTDLAQSTGRVLRGLDGKLQPLVVDLVDDHDVLQNMARSRLRYYRAQGWMIA